MAITRRGLEQNAASLILQNFVRNRLRTRIRVNPVNTMAFILNPYEADINLNTKEDRKLFKEGCAGLAEDDKFKGDRKSYTKFFKLLRVAIEAIKAFEVLTIGATFDSATAAPRAPATTINILSSSDASDEQVKTHCDLVWSTTPFGNNDNETPNYYKTFDTSPANTNDLNALRNQTKIRHVMLGHKIWNSFSSAPLSYRML